MKQATMVVLVLALAGCYVAPMSKRDIVAVHVGTQEHRSISRSCRFVDDVSGFSWQAGMIGKETGRYNATQDMMNRSPVETTHIAYGSGIDIGSRARGEAYECPKGFGL